MLRFRSILTLILVVTATLLVSCGGPTVKGPLYSAAQLTQIQDYLADVQVVRDRLETELPPLLDQQDWNDVVSFIHGPLGELRVRMGRLARSLAPKATQTAALDAANEVFDHLNAIDAAAQVKNIQRAISNYEAAVQDFETFLKYVPADAS